VVALRVALPGCQAPPVLLALVVEAAEAQLLLRLVTPVVAEMVEHPVVVVAVAVEQTVQGLAATVVTALTATSA
jgi:hypothetical protein